MKKAIIGIFLLAYLSGIITIAVGHFLQPLSSQSGPGIETYFIDEIETYPWVRYAKDHESEKEFTYYEQTVYLYAVDHRIGSNLLYTDWLKDYISDEEGRALELLVALSEEDPDIALSASQSTWFQKGISSDELALMEKVLMLSRQNIYVARNVASSGWFIFTGTKKVDQMINTLTEMPPDLALAVSFAPWFQSDISFTESRAIEELMTLYSMNKELALSISFVYLPQDFESLQKINELYAEDNNLVDQFLLHNTISRETFVALTDLSRIAVFDRDLAYSLTGTVTQDNAQIISSFAAIYEMDLSTGELARESFAHDHNALRYIHKVLEVETPDPALLTQVAHFVSDNPEVVYEDRTEPYRYHLLTEILSELPAETAYQYKNVIFVACSVYGNRFYLWKNDVYTTQNGWAYDKQLNDEEKDAVIDLIWFFIEKNEQGGLAVDLREKSDEYLYGVIDIPFTHLVNCDGTVKEVVYTELGTGFVLATITNIDTLEERYEKVQQQLQDMKEMHYGYTNPLVDLILQQGGEYDSLFLYFCAKNWEYMPCINQTLQTRMDSIVMGISTTTMHWTSPDSAHIYPAYIPTGIIAGKVEAAPDAYDAPFTYKGFFAPYDEAGFQDSLDRDIKIVEIYDPEEEKKVGLFYKPESHILNTLKIVAILAVGAGVLIEVTRRILG